MQNCSLLPLPLFTFLRFLFFFSEVAHYPRFLLTTVLCRHALQVIQVHWRERTYVNPYFIQKRFVKVHHIQSQCRFSDTPNSGYPEGYRCNSILNSSLFLFLTLHFPSLNSPLLSDGKDGRDEVAVFLIDPIVVAAEELWAIGFWKKSLTTHSPWSITPVTVWKDWGPWGFLRQCTHYLQNLAFLVFHRMSTRPDPTVPSGITESQVESSLLGC